MCTVMACLLLPHPITWCQLYLTLTACHCDTPQAELLARRSLQEGFGIN